MSLGNITSNCKVISLMGLPHYGLASKPSNVLTNPKGSAVSSALWTVEDPKLGSVIHF